MKKFKKLTALLLAVIMVFAMSVNALAATGDLNFTAAPGTEWSTEATGGVPVTVAAGPANSYFSFTGFDTAEDAKAAVVSYNCGEELVQSRTVDSVLVASTNTYATAITITPKTGVVGPISIHVAASTAAYAPSVDLTIYVEKASGNEPDATNISVEVVNLHDEIGMYEIGDNMTVKAAATESANPFSGSVGCAQSYPTAGGALYSLMRANQISFTQNEGYVVTISDSYGNSLPDYDDPDWTYNCGWNYCVMRDDPTTAEVDYEIVSESNVVSASVMPVQTGDKVFWAFGTQDVCADYFAELEVAY